MIFVWRICGVFYERHFVMSCMLHEFRYQVSLQITRSVEVHVDFMYIHVLDL